jgi:DNA-binding LytR/AlgR family response regulator
LKNPPGIILTTAYREFAADAFDLDVIDYLLKPVSFERFLKAVNRYFERSSPVSTESRSSDEDHVMIKSERKLVRVPLTEIRFVESLDDHVKIFLTDREITTRESISSIVHILPASRFVRIHRSFVVSMRHIDSVSGEGVVIGKRLIPFGRSYKQSAWGQLGIK